MGRNEPDRLVARLYVAKRPEENNMPVILLWGIPALIVIGGGGYWLMHVH